MDLKIGTDVRTSVPNMFVKFCGQQFVIFRKNEFFHFRVDWYAQHIGNLKGFAVVGKSMVPKKLKFTQIWLKWSDGSENWHRCPD